MYTLKVYYADKRQAIYQAWYRINGINLYFLYTFIHEYFDGISFNHFVAYFHNISIIGEQFAGCSTGGARGNILMKIGNDRKNFVDWVFWSRFYEN